MLLIRISGVVFLVISCGPAMGQSSSAPLEPSIVCRPGHDYELMSARIETAKQLGCRHANFVFTVNCTIDGDDRVMCYGLRSRSPATADGSQRDGWRLMTEELLTELTQ